MDVIDKAKNKLNSFYSNKIFRFFFFMVCIGAILYYYGNAKDKIKSVSTDSRVADNMNIPKKISFVKKAQDTLFLETSVKNEQNLDRKKRLEEMAALEKQRTEEREKAQKKIDDLKKEFTAKNTSKSTRRLVVGDIVEVKMIMTIGDDFSIPIEPMILPIKVSNEKNNIYGKYLVGKRIGDVVNIPFSEFLNNQTFKKEIEKIKKEQNIKDANINLDMLTRSNIIYRLKILKFK